MIALFRFWLFQKRLPPTHDCAHSNISFWLFQKRLPPTHDCAHWNFRIMKDLKRFRPKSKSENASWCVSLVGLFLVDYGLSDFDRAVWVSIENSNVMSSQFLSPKIMTLLPFQQNYINDSGFWLQTSNIDLDFYYIHEILSRADSMHFFIFWHVPFFTDGNLHIRSNQENMPLVMHRSANISDSIIFTFLQVKEYGFFMEWPILQYRLFIFSLSTTMSSLSRLRTCIERSAALASQIVDWNDLMGGTRN